MESDRIEKIIEKYFEAETNIAEEKELKNYFASSNVAKHLEHYKPIFCLLVHAKQEQCVITLPLIPSSKYKKRRRLIWLSIAASAVVLIGIGLFTFTNLNQSKANDLGTYNDPDVAFRETQKALIMISESVNRGIGSMGYLNEYQQSKNRIFKK